MDDVGQWTILGQKDLGDIKSHRQVKDRYRFHSEMKDVEASLFKYIKIYIKYYKYIKLIRKYKYILNIYVSVYIFKYIFIYFLFYVFLKIHFMLQP